MQITEPALSAGEREACQALLDDLPSAIGDRQRVDVSPAGALGAAWGDPPIVLTCGGDVPGDFDRTSGCQEANGVGWYAGEGALADESRDVTLSTVGYRPIVTVVVPAGQRPEGVASAMSALAAPVEEHTKLVQPCL